MASCNYCHQDRDAWLVIVYGERMAAELNVVCDSCWDQLDAAVSLRRMSSGPNPSWGTGPSLNDENESSR